MQDEVHILQVLVDMGMQPTVGVRENTQYHSLTRFHHR
jgi:hypothetical protein